VETRHRLHIDPAYLGGGDPLAIAERAFKICRIREREFGKQYFARAVILDRDRLGVNPERDAQIHAILYAGKIKSIWQSPTHEGFLLHHIQGCQTLAPGSAVLAMHRLRQEWCDYEKGKPATYLQTRLDLESVQLACSVEQDLAEFLASIKYFE